MNAPLPQRYRVGIDIGGTFTDLQILNETTGALFEHKTPSTPADPSEGFFTGLTEASDLVGFDLNQISMIMHGTTIATNAVLEMKMPKAALITTAGFEDVLEIGRHLRKDVYSLHAEDRKLLIERDCRFGVAERVDADGSVSTPLDEAGLAEIAKTIKGMGIDIVAVCLLNSFANAAHEQQIRAFFEREMPEVFVSLSCEISPEIREYDRMSTTVLNAMLMPVVRNYTDRLEARTGEDNLKSPILLVQSNGGVTGLKKAGEEPAKLLLSGPCGGTLAAEKLSAVLDEPNFIAIDMGGTSFDISLVHGGQSTMVPAGDIDGLPIRLSMVEMRTIGAGGGSIAWVDDTGRLRVGPQSASSVPGPVCYQRGGTQPTVTDANVVLGRVDPDTFLGGRMPLDRPGAQDAFAKEIGAPLGLTVNEAAEGVLKIVTSHMASAIRLTLFERGLDPTDFAAISFGGAGGLHAIDVAEAVGVKKVVFPANSSTLSAYGMLWSDIVHDIARSVLVPATAEAAPVLAQTVSSLIEQGTALLEKDGIDPADRAFEVTLDLRYRGQGYELQIPLAGAPEDPATLATACAAFHAEHDRRFSHSDAEEPVELVTVRLSARGLLSKPGIGTEAVTGEAAPREHRKIVVDGVTTDVPVYDRHTIGAEAELVGPAVIEEAYTTLYVPARWAVEMKASGHLIARMEE
ncbi:MAG: hydantoinase/oxoprolinase family protein [Pseudomonadota bacterium]|nr:hydantoinase/oxoprolinase family protein [Pseudomonadota bacterium]